MKPLPHDYDVDLTGGPHGYATISAAGLPDLTVAPPREYDGPGDAWSPEHLLLASVSSCFLFTFRAVVRASHADFLDVMPARVGPCRRSVAWSASVRSSSARR